MNYQMQRFIVRQKMKQKIVELSKKYPVSGIKPLSGQQQLFDFAEVSHTAIQRIQ